MPGPSETYEVGPGELLSRVRDMFQYRLFANQSGQTKWVVLHLANDLYIPGNCTVSICEDPAIQIIEIL